MRSGPVLVVAALALAGLAAFLLARWQPGGVQGLTSDALESERASEASLDGESTRSTPEGTRREADADAMAAAESEDAARVAAERTRDFANELRGRVVDVKGIGIADCSVTLLPALHDAFGGVEREIPAQAPAASTEVDGQFLFAAVEPGEALELLVRHEGYAPALVPGVVIGERGVYEEPPIVLRRGKRLSGFVLDDLGAPIPGAHLTLESGWKPAPHDARYDALEATTGPDGGYEIFGIPDGRRSLTARAEGFGTQTMPEGILFEDRIGPAYRRDFRMQRALVLAGRVVARDGLPISGARVIAQDRRNARLAAHGAATSAADGSFAISDLQPGRYVLSAEAEGLARAFVPDLEPPLDGVELELETLPALRGRVIDGASGGPLASFTLRLRSEGLPGMASSPRGAPRSFENARDGEFELPGLFEGSFQLEAGAPGYAPSFSESFVCDGRRDVSDLVMEMRRGASISGSVVDASGEPLAGASISCSDDEVPQDLFTAALGDELPTLATATSARSDARGRFHLEHLHPQTYRLRVFAAGRAPRVVRGIALAEGDALELDPIAMGAGCALRGRLFDADRHAVAGGRVLLRALGSAAGFDRRCRKSGERGEYAFEDLAPGRYAVAGAPPLSDAELADDPLAWYTGAGRERTVELVVGAEAPVDLELSDWRPPESPPEPPPTGNVNGRVTDAGGAALVGVALELAPREGDAPSQTAKSERDGEFVFLRVPPGRYTLRIAEGGHAGVEVEVQADRFTHQDLVSP